MSDIDETRPIPPYLPPRTRPEGKHAQRQIIGMGVRGTDQFWHQVICKFDMYLPDNSPDVCHPEVQIGHHKPSYRCEVFTACGRHNYIDPCAGYPIFTDTETHDLCGFCWIGRRP